jgi:hypothetical protein
MYQGRIVDIVDPERATPELLGLLMGGSAPTVAEAAAAVGPATDAEGAG